MKKIIIADTHFVFSGVFLTGEGYDLPLFRTESP